MKWFVTVLIVLMAPSLALADTREEKVATLMKVQGIEKTWQQQLDQNQIDGKKMGEQMFAQLKDELNPNEEYMLRMEGVFNTYMEKVSQSPLNAAEITETWAQIYGAKFTDEELDQLIVFYSSDIGQKEVQLSRESQAEFSLIYKEKMMQHIQGALGEYIEDLKAIVAECHQRNCTRA